VSTTQTSRTSGSGVDSPCRAVRSTGQLAHQDDKLLSERSARRSVPPILPERFLSPQRFYLLFTYKTVLSIETTAETRQDNFEMLIYMEDVNGQSCFTVTYRSVLYLSLSSHTSLLMILLRKYKPLYAPVSLYYSVQTGYKDKVERMSSIRLWFVI